MVAIVQKSLSRFVASCYADQAQQAGTEQPNGSGNGDESWWDTCGFCRREQPVHNIRISHSWLLPKYSCISVQYLYRQNIQLMNQSIKCPGLNDKVPACVSNSDGILAFLTDYLQIEL